MRAQHLFITAIVLTHCASSAVAQPPPRFKLAEADRVVLLGNALIEHERFHGYLETRLRRHCPAAKISVRNLGWAGDTVRGDARTSGYQNPEGMARLLKEVKELKPTVVFIGYGMNESFAGPDGLDSFIRGYRKLLDDLAITKSRVVILSPTWHEDLGRPLPDPADHNRSIAAYAAGLRALAADRGLAFIDLHQAPPKSTSPLTSNGILLNEIGYWHLAAAVERQLGLPADDDGVAFRYDEKSLVPTMLSAPPMPGVSRDTALVRVEGLPPGKQTLTLSGVALATATAADWRRGVPVPAAAFLEDVESLRKSIVLRNDLFFRGWRPFNDHSRHWGFMAKDFRLFADLVQRQDEVIDGLRSGRATSLAVVPAEKSK